MLNTKKLIYLLPDVTYIAELLPGKKEHTFSVQAFRQINGDFLDDNELIGDNVAKLVQKIESEEYALVLPDFLFTNTIVEVEETSESKVNEYLQEKLLPKLNLSQKTHQIETSILTEYNKKSKVQIAALEKTLLSSFRVAAAEKKIAISGVYPLSWIIKSLVSLEPSITVIQMGEYLYLAQHYIGVDQATSFKVDEVENISESIKTLKGAEPNIQTVYLLTNQLIEEKLKELLSDTVPLQQLTNFTDEEGELPSFIKQIIETSIKTVDIGNFPIPQFSLGKVSESDKQEKKKEAPKEDEKPKTSKNDENDKENEKKSKDADSEESEADDKDTKTKKDLPKPQPHSETEDLLDVPETPTDSNIQEDNTPPVEVETVTLKTTHSEEKTQQKETNTTEDKAELKIEKKEETTEDNNKQKTGTNADEDESVTSTQKQESRPTTESNQKMVQLEEEDDQSQEDNQEISSELEQFAARSSKTMTEAPKQEPTVVHTRPIIKNQSNTSNMVKMILITIGVLVVTVAIGVALGLGFLQLSNRGSNQLDNNPVVQVKQSPTPTPEATPTPTPEPELEKSELEILVVNATTKAGYAGDIKTMLVDDEFENVDAANAKGEYEEGMYVLMTEENPALIQAIEEATDLEFSYQDSIADEDPKEAYDAVVVLAE